MIYGHMYYIITSQYQTWVTGTKYVIYQPTLTVIEGEVVLQYTSKIVTSKKGKEGSLSSNKEGKVV